MEQRAVHDGAEAAVIPGERADIGDLEGGIGQPALGGLGPGELDRGRLAGLGEQDRSDFRRLLSAVAMPNSPGAAEAVLPPRLIDGHRRGIGEVE
jgi:hypothetical protein